MVKNKKAPKKQQRGVDFKKIKRKIGRKLPLPKNTTNTEIKSKAIILPEQSVASDKAGLAVSKKGLTLKELLQQTSHHNSKVRKDALIGIRDILLKYPAELRLHKLAVVEKLRERISDDDKIVRETLYQLLKSAIFPGCKEDNQGPFISLMMAYIFNAMTNLAIDIRLMAFRFLDLVIQHYPSSFMLYSEKIFQSYEDLLRKNQFHIQEKGTLKNVLASLVYCLSLLPGGMDKHESPREKEVGAARTMHAFEPIEPKNTTGKSVINEKLRNLMPVLVRCFQDILPLINSKPQLDAQSFDCLLFILESIDLAARFFGGGFENTLNEREVSMFPYQGIDTSIQRKNISPSVLKKLFDLFPLNPRHQLSGKDDSKYFILNAKLTEIFLSSSEWHSSSGSLDKFMEFIADSLSEEISSAQKTLLEKNLLPLIPFIPRLALHVSGYWRSRLLQAFTEIFKSCSEDSLLKWVFLSAIEEMLIRDQGFQQLSADDSEIFDYQISWTREFPLLLIKLGNKQPSRCKSVLSLLLQLGQRAVSDSFFSQEYDNIQYSLAEFYCTCMDGGNVSYGPFVQLDREGQELSICCLYYLSHMDSLLLKSIALCCLYEGLDPLTVMRMIEVLDSAYRVGHIQMFDLVSFFITLLARFKIVPENSLILEKDDASNRGVFKSITRLICSSLLQMGDGYLVLQILESAILSHLSLKPALDNLCALLRMLVSLDSRPTRLSDQSIVNLSKILPGYLIDVVLWFSGNEDELSVPWVISSRYYYLLPCLFLFYRSNKLLSLVLNAILPLASERMSSISSHSSYHSNSVNAVVSLILLLNKDHKIHRQLSSCKVEIDSILQSLLVVQSAEENMAIDEKHKIQSAVCRLRNVVNDL